MNEAKRESAEEYSCFNDFFCRSLKDSARTIAAGPTEIASPADGAFSQLGKIEKGRIFQAKGQNFSTLELLGGDEKLAEQFDEGSFATIYLSPKDYHRVHMPIDGTLRNMTHIPGQLFSVNGVTAENVPRLFARNERVSCIFDTEVGPVAMVLVGAMIVASIDTVWHGQVAPVGKNVTSINYLDQPTIHLKKGDEMGRFKLGSTVVLLFPKDTINWKESIDAGTPIMMGENIGEKLS